MRRNPVPGLGVLGTVVLIASVHAAQNRSGAPTTRPALFTDAQVKSGEQAYLRTCASCHGRALTGGTAPPLTGPAFARSWRDPRVTLDDLFFVMRTTMPPRKSNALTADELIGHCRGRIASFKVPRHVFFVDEFPMTTSGKIQKAKLREEALHKRPS